MQWASSGSVSAVCGQSAIILRVHRLGKQMEDLLGNQCRLWLFQYPIRLCKLSADEGIRQAQYRLTIV